MRSLVFGCADAMPCSTARPAAVPPVRTADFRRNSRRAIRPASSSAASPFRRASVAIILVARQLSVDAPVRLLHVLEDDLDLVGGRLADLHHRLGDRGGDLALLLVGAPGVPLNRDVRHGLSPRSWIRGSDYRSGLPAGQGSPAPGLDACGALRAGTIVPRACLTPATEQRARPAKAWGIGA